MDRALAVLVEQSRQGDREAFAELVRRYQRFVFQVAYGVIPNAADAEDVAQEALIKAYSSLGSLHDAAAFPTWLARIATRLALNKASRSPNWILQEPERIEGAAPDPEESAEAADLRVRIHAAIRTLPVYYRAPLLLRDLDGYSYREIAQMLEIPEGTVKSRIHAARQLLRQHLLKEGV